MSGETLRSHLLKHLDHNGMLTDVVMEMMGFAREETWFVFTTKIAKNLTPSALAQLSGVLEQILTPAERTRFFGFLSLEYDRAQQNREVRKVHNERNVGSVYEHLGAFVENPKNV